MTVSARLAEQMNIDRHPAAGTLSAGAKVVSFEEMPNAYELQQKGVVSLEEMALPFYAAINTESDQGDHFAVLVPVGGGAEPITWQQAIVTDLDGSGAPSLAFVQAPQGYTGGFTPLLDSTQTVARKDEPDTVTQPASTDKDAQTGETTKTQETDPAEGTTETSVTVSNPYAADDDLVHPVFGEAWG